MHKGRDWKHPAKIRLGDECRTRANQAAKSKTTKTDAEIVARNRRYMLDRWHAFFA